MSFKDIIKKSILEGFNTDISLMKILVSLGFALTIGLFIYSVYRIKTKKAFYAKDFNTVLAILPIITAGIVLAMSSSIVISLGMVGALSIVRFRNAVKSSLDLMFLFWSISVGIICGAGLYQMALVLSLVVTIALFLVDILPSSKPSSLLIINASNRTVEGKLLEIVKKNTSHYKIKSRSMSKMNVDLVIEIRSKKESTLLEECSKIKGVELVNILSHDGESRL